MTANRTFLPVTAVLIFPNCRSATDPEGREWASEYFVPVCIVRR